jgi:Na+-transporting methylmalonyl-CoA/oxaloacetate decarboxylase gamma subunit
MNNLDLILAVSGPEVPANASGTLEIVGVGFIFVMVVLALLAMVTSALGAIFSRVDARAAAKSAVIAAEAAAKIAAMAPAAPVASDDDQEDSALVAVLAAAVHSVIGDRAHRIVSIRPGGPGWAQEGRRQIFSSHRVR